MLKVLYLLNHAGEGGTEKYVRTLAQKLDGKGIKAYLAYNEYGPLVGELEKLGIKAIHITMNNPYDIKAAALLSSICRELGINIIHAQFLRENYIAVISRFFSHEVKVLYTDHIIRRNSLFLRLTNRLLTPFDAYIISVCKKGQSMLMKNGVKRDRIRVIYNGADLDLWSTPFESRLKSEFGIQEDAFIIICIARFTEEKGHRFLMDSIARLKGKTKTIFKCVLAGDGPLLEDIKQYAKDLGIHDEVLFTGHRGDIANLLYGSDLCVNSSENEALSFANLEALTAGKPLIATDVGGNSDIVNAGDTCGILVKYGDAEEMSEAILSLMENKELRIKLGENSLKTVREYFNVDKMIQETYNLYEACNKKT